VLPFLSVRIFVSPLPGHFVQTASSTRPELHYVSHRRQKRTEPRLWIPRRNIRWTSDTYFRRYAHGDRQTRSKRHAHHNTAFLYWERSKIRVHVIDVHVRVRAGSPSSATGSIGAKWLESRNQDNRNCPVCSVVYETCAQRCAHKRQQFLNLRVC